MQGCDSPTARIPLLAIVAPASKETDCSDGPAHMTAYNPESEGLQVIRGPHAVDSSPRDAEGLQVFEGPRTVRLSMIPRGQVSDEQLETSDARGKKDSINSDQSLFNDRSNRVTTEKLGSSEMQLASEQTASKARRRKSWWIIVGTTSTTIVVILAVVIGTVLGIRASNKMTPKISTTGTYWGTGITNAVFEPFGSKGYVIFQDYTGTLLQAVYNVDNTTHKLSLESPQLTTLPNDAANSTALASILDQSNTSKPILHLIYVNHDGVLAELAQENTPSGAWMDGKTNLSSHGFRTPCDNRAAIDLRATAIDGKNGSGWKLFAGGLDNKIHQYSYDVGSTSWASSSTWDFDNSWAYGSALIVDETEIDVNTTHPTINRTLFTTDSQGDILAYVQNNHRDFSSDWPSGGKWNTPIASQQHAASNSSLIPGVRYGQSQESQHNGITFGVSSIALIFADKAGRTTALNLNDSLWYDTEASQTGFVGLSADFPALEVMSGSAFSFEEPSSSTSLIWYQDSGETLAWAVLNATLSGILASGHVVQQDNGWVSLCDGTGCT